MYKTVEDVLIAMKTIKALVLTLVLLLLPIFGCDDSDESSSLYNFKVLSLGEGFSGYYIVDGDETIEFNNKALESGDVYYKFEKDLNNPTTVQIRADGIDPVTGNTDPYTTYLEIKIYQDKKEVASKTGNKNVDDHLGIYLSYDFSTEDKDTTK